MKILFVTPFPPPMGGIGNWSKMVINHLNENVNDIEARYINTAPKKRNTDGRSIFDRIFGGFISILKTIKQLKKELKEFKPDVVHINTSGSLALFRDIEVLKILKKQKINSVVFLHFGRVPIIFEKKCLEQKLLRKVFILTNKVIALDKDTENVINDRFENKAICLPNPFNLSNDIIPKKLDKNNSSNLITYVGWVIPTKGIEELVCAWDEINLKFPTWKLQIIGPYQDKYISELKSKYSFENIILYGEKPHDETLKLINISEVLILPSYTEGFPNVILEAMSLGKAVIATNVGAISQMFENNSGYIIKSKSKDEIVNALNSIMMDDEFRILLAENALEKVKEYSLQKVVNLYFNTWRNL